PYASQASKSFDNVTVFDSEHISSGHGLMVLYAASLAEEGKSIPEICKALEQYKDLVCSNFLVPNTTALYRNGKLGGVVHKLCSGLNLHPVLRMSQNKLKLWKIETGNMQRMNRKYVRSLLHNSRQIDTRLLFLTYAGCSVRQLDEILAEVEKYVKFDKIILQKASAPVSSNCGSGVVGLRFVRKKGI
ncbi:MAG: DegV family protein, partial [Acetatifactor sp.]|nr:DegV family protein [Acetatifactor sp.]